MNRAEIETTAKSVIAEQLCLTGEQGADKLTADTTFESLQADSLDMVELAIALEEKFEVEIPDDEADKLVTVGNAVDYIVKALAA